MMREIESSAISVTDDEPTAAYEEDREISII